jgi:hypothetical protein
MDYSGFVTSSDEHGGLMFMGNNRFLLHTFQLIIRYHPAIRVNILTCRRRNGTNHKSIV